MDTYQNPFESLADPEIERFSLYLRYRNAQTPEAFAAAAGLTIAQALKWAAQPIIEACLEFHINRQFKLLTLDALNIRREAMHSTLELTTLLKAHPLQENLSLTKEGQKRDIARRHQVSSLLRAFSIMSRLVGSSLTTTIKNLQSPPTSPSARSSRKIPTITSTPTLQQAPPAKSAEEIAPTAPESAALPTNPASNTSPVPENQTASPTSPTYDTPQTEISSQTQNLASEDSPQITTPNPQESPQENAPQSPTPTENPFPYPLNSQRLFPGHPLIPIDNQVLLSPIRRFKR